MSGDPQLDNLQQYMSIASNALERLQAVTPEIESRGDELDDLEDQVDSTLSDFDTEVDGCLKDLERAENEALAEVSKLTALADDASGDRLPDGQQDLEQAASRVESALDAGGRELESDHQGLDSEGFDHLATTLDAAQKAFDTARTQNEAAFNAFEQALQAAQQEADTAYGEAAREFEAADQACDQEAAELTSETGTLVEGMNAAGGEFGGKVSEIESEAGTAYDGVNDEVETETGELTTGVFQVLEAEARYLATDLTDSIEQSSTLVSNDSAGPHLDELGSMQEAVSRAESTSVDLDPLVGDLQRCQSVMELIDKLLREMD